MLHRSHRRDSRGGHRGRPRPTEVPAALPRHPWIKQDRRTMMLILSKNEKASTGILLHPLQVGLFLKFDTAVSTASPERRAALHLPFGYHSFARFFNSVPVDKFKYRVVEYNAQTQLWAIPDHRVIPGSIYTNFFDRERYRELTAIGLITARGDVDKRKLVLFQIAIERLFDDAYRRNIYFQRREEERNANLDDGEAYFDTGVDDDVLSYWAAALPSTQDQASAVMAASLSTIPEESFSFDNPLIIATEGVAGPSTYTTSSPNADPAASASPAHTTIEAAGQEATSAATDVDMSMDNAGLDEFMTDFTI